MSKVKLVNMQGDIEQITFVAAIMGFEATLLWQLFKMKKALMS